MLTKNAIIKWPFKLAFPKEDSFEGWVSTDQDDGYWRCRFYTGWRSGGRGCAVPHDARCKYKSVKTLIAGLK